ncbi:helix-turn-helix protein [Nocardiopsis sp. Huas11]|nr:helix-turn-helix protein [Nocardiopsis sp. Huas11]
MGANISPFKGPMVSICANCGRERASVANAKKRCSCIPKGFWDASEAQEAAGRLDAGSLVRLLRSRTDLSQEALGRLTGLSQSMVSQLESHKRDLKDVVKLRRFLNGLGAPRVTTTRTQQESVESTKLLAHAAQVTMGAAEIDPHRWRGPNIPETPLPVRRVTGTDVDHVETVTKALRAADYQLGGGACLDAIMAHLAYAHRLLRAAKPANQLGLQLYRAVADLHNLAGWASFDVGHYKVAAEHLSLALEQAQYIEEPSLVANVLYRMGRLHLHRGHTLQALRFLQLGQIAAQDSGCERTVALMCANAAWAYAVLDDQKRSMDSLARAHDAFARAEADTTPWVRFFHETDLDAMSGVVNAALPTPSPRAYTATTEHLYRAVDARSPAMGRSQAFELTTLATAHIRNGDPDQGVHVGRQAVDLARQVRSVRVIDRLAPLQQAALAYRTRGETAELAAEIATLRTS